MAYIVNFFCFLSHKMWLKPMIIRKIPWIQICNLLLLRQKCMIQPDSALRRWTNRPKTSSESETRKNTKVPQGTANRICDFGGREICPRDFHPQGSHPRGIDLKGYWSFGSFDLGWFIPGVWSLHGSLMPAVLIPGALIPRAWIPRGFHLRAIYPKRNHPRINHYSVKHSRD